MSAVRPSARPVDQLVRSALAALAVVAGLVVLARPGRAAAYPQFLSEDNPRCASCHLSPAGGNLLNENGLAFAESSSQLGTAPEFLNGVLPTPDWLTLGGDLRASAGFAATPEKILTAFPMQSELYAAARFGSISVHVTAGGRPMSEADDAPPPVWSREHYVMWAQEAGGTRGSFLRLGRFMPVFGLRLAEHPAYTRKWGGTPLFAETYGLHAAHVSDRWEAHVTGFLADPLFTSAPEQASGAAGYAEVTVADGLSLGGEGMYQRTDDDQKIRVGAIARYTGVDKLVIQGEVQFVNQLIDETPTNPDGGAPKQIVGYVMASRWLTDALLLDVALGHFDANIRIRDMDRDAVDMNLHYFLTSHVELVWNNRFEMIGFTKGGASSGFSLLQLHYRL